MTLNYLGGTGKGDTQRKRNEDIDLKGSGTKLLDPDFEEGKETIKT